MSNAVFDFLLLLGDVDVHRQAAHLSKLRELSDGWRICGAQRMHGYAYVDIRHALRMGQHIVYEAGDGFGRGRKALLVGTQASGTKARAHVQRGQKRDADTHALGGAHQGHGHLERRGGWGAQGGIV